MDKDEVAEDWFSSIETNSSKNNSKDPIPDALYYLVRPQNSEIIYIMDKKPDYNKEPFYSSCAGCKVDMRNYLINHSVDTFDTGEISIDKDNYLFTLGICPDEDSVSYIFSEPKKANVFTTLTSLDTYIADKEVANYYKAFDWHIKALLSLEPFKTYIENTYGSKDKTPEVVKKSENSETSLNKRLLI